MDLRKKLVVARAALLALTPLSPFIYWLTVVQYAPSSVVLMGFVGFLFMLVTFVVHNKIQLIDYARESKAKLKEIEKSITIARAVMSDEEINTKYENLIREARRLGANV